MSSNVAPQIDKPIAHFQYNSDVGAAQNVCSLDGLSGLTATGLNTFPLQAGSVAFWVKTASTTVGAQLFAYHTPAPAGGLILQVSNPVNVQISIGTGTTGPTGIAINDNLWHQLIVTYQRVSPKNFTVSIVKDALELYRSRSVQNTQDLGTGGDFYLGGSASGLAGLVSELQVWDHVLSTAEIATGLFRRAVDPTVGLILHWGLNTAPPGNPNAQIVASDLTFRTGAGSMSWNAITSATAYEIVASSTDGLWQETNAQVAGTSYALPALPLNRRLGARVRALQGSEQGPWSDTVEISAFELGQAVVAQVWNETTQALTAQWPADVARRENFTLELYQNANPPVITPGYTTLNYDLTSKLDDPDTWRLDVRAFAAGSQGPAEFSIPSTAPNLSILYQSTGQQLVCTWAAIAGAQYFRLRIVPASGPQQPYSIMVNGTSTQATITNAQYPFTPGIIYQIELRALGGGTLSAWADQQLNVHTVPAPVLSWTYTSASDVLDAVWNAVTASALYNLDVYRGSDVTPIVHLQNQPLAPYPMSTYLSDNNIYRVLVAAIDQGVQGPTNQPIAPGVLSPLFQYYAGPQTLNISWSLQQQDAYLRLIKNSTQPPFQAGRFTTGSATFPAPVAQFPENTIVDLNVRGLTPGEMGSIETARITVHLLTKPVPTLQYNTTTSILTASWAAIAPPPPLLIAYQVQITVDGTGGPIQNVAGLSADVTSTLSTVGAIVIDIRGTVLADGCIGPWSDAATVATPTGLSVVYDQVASTLAPSWTSVAALDALYVEIWKANDSAPSQHAWLAGSATTTTLSAPTGSSGQAVTTKVRAVKGDALSAFDSTVMTLTQIPGPALQALTESSSPNKITANWTFDSSAISGTVLGYSVQLSQGGQVLETQAVLGAGTLTYSFTETATLHFTIGTTYSVVVRANVQPVAGQTILGAWSQSQAITFGLGNLTIQTFQVTSDSDGNLTLNWSVTQMLNGMTFEVQILTTSFDRTGITGTSLSLLQSTTSVVVGNTYTLQIRATVGNVSGDWKQQSVKAGEVKPPPDPATPNRGDPINLATGAFVYTNPDMVLVGVVPLELMVHYRSDSPLPSDNPGLPSTPMGARWNHSYNTRIQKASDGKTVSIIWGNLTIIVYTVPASITGYYQQQGISDGSTLYVDSNLNYTLTSHDQSVYFFNPQGVLQWIQSSAGNLTNLTYSSNRLDRVTDAGSGRYLQFSYDQNGRIQSVATSAGTHISYVFDANGNLTQYTDPQTGSRNFTYDSQSHILTTTDQKQLTLVKNTYDPTTHKITFQQDARAIAGGASYGTTFLYTVQANTLVTVVTDRLGEVTTYTFDKTTQLPLSEIVDLGNGQVQKTISAYDGNGNVVSRSIFEGASSATTLGNTWLYTYDGNNNMTSVTDPLGGIESQSFSPQNQRLSFTDRLGNTSSFTYVNNLLTQVTDVLQQHILFTYKAGTLKGLVESVTDIYGAVTGYTYDNQGQLIHITDSVQTITDVDYNNAGWTVYLAKRPTTGAALYTENRTVNTMGWVTERKNTYVLGQPLNQPFTTLTGYDADGHVTTVTDPLNRTTGYTYDPVGLRQQITYPSVNPPADTTTFTYDREDRLSSIDYGVGVSEQYAYDALGRIIRYTNPNRAVSGIVYTQVPASVGNSFNLVQTTTLPINAPGTSVPLTVQIVQDALGRIVSETNTAVETTTTAYNRVPTGGAYGLQTVITLPKTDPLQPQPYTTSETRDFLGHLLEKVDAAGKHTTMTYASASTVPNPGNAVLAVTTTRPSHISEIALYDGLGRLLETRRGSGNLQRSVKRVYDVLNRKIQVVETSAGVSATTTCDYSYSAGTLITTVNAYAQGGPIFHFDAASQLIEAVDQAGKPVSYTYTPRGLIDTFTNARGQTVSYAYDAASRQTGTILPANGGTITHHLDYNGNRLQTLLNNVSQITRTFDPLDRLLSRTDNPNQTAVAYAYNARGNLATLTYPVPTGQNPINVQYSYDGLGRMTSVVDWATRHTQYTYYPTGPLQSSQGPDGVSSAYNIDDDGRLTQFTTKIGAITIADARYAYNDFDEVSNLREILPTPVHQQTSTRHFTYQETRLTLADSTPITYDDDGNMTSLPSLTGSLTYDVFNELVQAGNRSYQFDVDGLRTHATTPQGAQSYVYDIGGYANPLREQANVDLELSNAVNVPVPSGDGMQTPILGGDVQEPLSALDRLLVASNASGQTRYVHGVGLIGTETPDGQFSNYIFDGQGSTLALAAQNGTITARHAYDLFGAQSGDVLTQPFGFVGRYGVIADTPDLLYMRSRNYAPSLLRFSGQDYLFGELITPQSLNRYLYVNNNPLLQIDPLGEDGLSVWGIIGIVAGVVAGVVIIVFLPEIISGLGTLLTALGGTEGTLLSAGTSLRNFATLMRYTRPWIWRRILIRGGDYVAYEEFAMAQRGI